MSKKVEQKEEVKSSPKKDPLIITLLGTYSNGNDRFVVQEVQLDLTSMEVVAHKEHECSGTADMRDRYKILSIDLGVIE